MTVISRKKIGKNYFVCREIQYHFCFYGAVMKSDVSVFKAWGCSRSTKADFWISVPTDSGFRPTSFISHCIWLSGVTVVSWGSQRTIIQSIFYLRPCCLLLVQLFSASLALCVPTMATDQQGHACGGLVIGSIFLFDPVLGDDFVPDAPCYTIKNTLNVDLAMGMLCEINEKALRETPHCGLY